MMMSLAFFPKMLRFISAAEEYKEKVESVLYPFYLFSILFAKQR